MATLIPKIVHFCWLSDNPYPADVRRCMATWREKLPGYTFMHWDFTRFPRGTSKWVDDAFDAGQFAFAADYIRLYALKHYGGIYLDADVEVLKPFDDLLQLPYFIGYESANEGIEAAALGFEKNHPLIEAMLRTYDGQHFIQADGSFHDITLPKRFFACIKQGFDLKEITSIREFDRLEKTVCVLPSDFFSPKNFLTLQIRRTTNTYTIHHFAGSWLSPGRRFYLCCRRGAERLLGDTYDIFSSVKPGVTGLWQVSGRSDTDYNRRVALDAQYVLNWSPWMDIWILVRTVGAVIFMRGSC